MEFCSPNVFLDPQLTVTTQAFLRASYGVLLLATLTMVLSRWRHFFVSERWGGYAQSLPDVDRIHNPEAATAVGVLWFICAIMLSVGQHPVLSSAANLILCRYFFVHMRWKGLLRGFGAPGFMTYWLGAVVFLLELTLHYAPSVRPLALLVAQVDFAFIMLSSGLYKYSAGYANNLGMELGMVNPMWGYWWKFFRKVPPGHVMFKALNHLAWSTEVVAGIMMLVPVTRFIGAMLILVSFVFIATQIRLGVLCEVVIVCCFLFFHPGSLGDQLVSLCTMHSPGLLGFTPADQPILARLSALFLYSYLILLPLAHVGLFYNFYARKSLPGPLQAVLEKYTNFFGIIIWRVFSADHTNFFPLIYCCSHNTNKRELLSRYGWQGGLRFDNVGESIVLTTLFTTLKYFSSNPGLFTERLLRYARTVPCPDDCFLEFEYISIRKTDVAFEYVPVAAFLVDKAANTVTEKALDATFSVRSPHATSPLHEGVRPGSYVPLSS